MNAWLNGDTDKDIHISTGLALKSESERQTFHSYGTDLHQELDQSKEGASKSLLTSEP